MHRKGLVTSPLNGAPCSRLERRRLVTRMDTREVEPTLVDLMHRSGSSDFSRSIGLPMDQAGMALKWAYIHTSVLSTH